MIETPRYADGPTCTSSELVAVLDLLGDVERVLDRDGVALGLAPAGGGGGDADDLTLVVEERAAGVAADDVRVGLDQAGEVLAVDGALGLGVDRLVERDDGAGEADRKPWPWALPTAVTVVGDGRVAVVVEVDGGEVAGAVELEQRDVGGLVVADDGGVVRRRRSWRS